MANSYRCKDAPVYDPYRPDQRHKAILYKTGLPQWQVAPVSPQIGKIAYSTDTKGNPFTRTHRTCGIERVTPAQG